VNRESLNREAVLSFRLEKIEEQLDVFWRQRTHVRWMQEGDKNMAYFHTVCREGKRSNRIGRLKEVGEWWYEGEEQKRSLLLTTLCSFSGREPW